MRVLAKQTHPVTFVDGAFIAMDLVDPAIDFLSLAASMSIPARRIDRAQDIAPALEAAVASGAANFA